MGPAHETTNGWQDATPEELEEAMEQMREAFEFPTFLEKKLQKDQYKITQKNHSKR